MAMKTTQTAVRAILAADPTVDADLTERVVAMMDEKCTDGWPLADEPLATEEVAKMLRCTTRTVMNYANRGKIRRIGGRATGTQTRYSKRSVLAFLEGRAA